MFKVEVIGNLGADAQVKGENGREFISFNVAHSDRWTDQQGTKHETTQWISCIINDKEAKVLPYLNKGKSVYIRGDGRLRIYSSEQAHGFVPGITVNVREIELVGAKREDKPTEQTTEENDGTQGKPF